MLRRIASEFVGDSPSLVVDVGANVGASLLELKLGAPHARFLCLEPSRRFARALQRTVRANDSTDVLIMRFAAGLATTKRTLFVNATTASVVAAAYGERAPLGAERVRTVKLDDLLASEPDVALLKSDTDGFEVDVLVGARRTLERCRPALFLEFDPSLLAWGGRDPNVLPQLLDELGYRSFVTYAPSGETAVVQGVAALSRAVPEGSHVNILAVHESTAEPEQLRRMA
jgi:FkbM family methyltransferase